VKDIVKNFDGPTSQLFIPAFMQKNKTVKPAAGTSFPKLEKAAFSVVKKILFTEDLSADAITAGMAVPVPENVGSLLARTDNDLSLGVVGAAYHPVQNETLHKAVERTLYKSLPSTLVNGTVLTEQTNRNGAFVRLMYSIPALYAVIPQLNGTSTKMSFAVIAKNTHGSTSVEIKAASIDHACDNINVYGAGSSVSKRHTENFSTEEMELFLERDISTWSKRMRLVRKWAMAPLSLDDAEMVVSPFFSHGNRSKILDQYLDECLARGESVGALVAALTTWSSHNNDRFYVRNSHNVDNVAESLSKREDTVAKVLDSEMFAKVSA